jgi:hypothetical protein
VKFLINYTAGCKGDFVTNYLNDHNLSLEDKGNNRSRSFYQIDTLQTNNELFLKFLKYHNNIKFINTHDISTIDKNFLSQNSVTIAHITSKQKYFPTIFIEGTLKNALFDGANFKIDEKNNVVNFYLNQDENYYKFQEIEDCRNTTINSIPLHKSYIGQIDKIQYRCDFYLLENNYKINNDNRYNFYENLLKTQVKNIKNYTAQWFFETNKTIEDIDIVLRYEDLFVNKNFDTIKKLDKNFDELQFQSMLEETWLPDNFNLFGKKINLRDYGYRNWL